MIDQRTGGNGNEKILKSYLDNQMKDIENYVLEAKFKKGSYIKWSHDNIIYVEGILSGYITANVFEYNELKPYYGKLEIYKSALTTIEEETKNE